MYGIGNAGGRGYNAGDGGGWGGGQGYYGGDRDFYGGGGGRGGGGGGGGRGGPTWQKDVVCKFFLQNRCSRGSSCWFIHPTGGTPAAAPPPAQEYEALVPSMTRLALDGRRAGGEEETIGGPDLINTLPDRVLARIFELLGDNYIQLARLALVCRRWRTLSEDDTRCDAWRRAAEGYYLYQNGSMKRAEGSWKSFFGMMIAFEDGMMGDAFDAYQNDQAWGELLDGYEHGHQPWEEEGAYYDPYGQELEDPHHYAGGYEGVADQVWNGLDAGARPQPPQ